MNARAARQYDEAAAILAAEIAEQDAAILADDATWANPELEDDRPIDWLPGAEHSTNYVRNGSMG